VELAAAGEDTWPVECVILKDDERDLPALTLAENEIRVEDSPLVRAKKVERMLQHGHTLDEVALACGKSKATVESWRALLDLDRGIQGKVERGEVSATAVTKLARLPREQQKERLATLEQAAQENPSKRPTVRQTRQPTDHPTPGRRELKAALAVCPPDAVLAIKWVLGDIDAPWPVEKKKKPVEKPTEKKTPTEKPTAAEKPTTQKLTAVLYQA
jgi:ParB-like chromosome segregation protein Spo0J